MIRHYYYNSQLKKFMLGFAAIFAGLQVRTGMGRDGTISEINVPIRYGSADRVVEAMGTDHTSNKLNSLPIMSCYMTGLELAPDRFHGIGGTDRRSFMKQGGVFPDDVQTITRIVPIPYNMLMELNMYASNSDQMLQMLEQILMIFDGYDLQVQFNDKIFDWTRVTNVKLLSIGNEEPWPAGTERRALIQNLQFEVPIWLSPPADIRNDIVREIRIRLGDLNDFTLDQYDENGTLAPFIEPWNETQINAVNVVTNVNPTSVTIFNPEHYDASEDDCRC